MTIAGFSMFPTKECELVMVANDDLYHAYMGTDIYKKLTKGKGVKARLLMLGTRIPAGQVVAGDSGIKTYEDLRGKRVFLRFGASLALRMGATAALYGGGLTEKDVKVMTATNLVVATRMVIEGKADATYGAVGVPIFRELAAARKGARHLSINDTPESWKKINKVSPAYFPMRMKKGPMSLPEDTVLVGRNFGLTARVDLSDEAAYIVTKLLWENDKELGPKHPRLKDWVKAQFVSTRASAPYHPGAIKFYKEVGAWKPEHEKHNQKMLSLKK
ncbi:MAG: TAXI family TRAP transporter solute-binding subunit [Deltaproteobacteria bacterium]|nr:TAXI family TRAP transporter solute-binding subunit [Deltaproteobacteria bacterium]